MHKWRENYDITINIKAFESIGSFETNLKGLEVIKKAF